MTQADPRPHPSGNGPAAAADALPFAAHGALVVWALWAWIHGPFGGDPVLDGAEVVAMANGQHEGRVTKSPLLPALLSWMGTGPWIVGVWGLGMSWLAQGVVWRWARDLSGPWAARAAAWIYASCGSVYAFSVQPLPAMTAAGLLAAGAYAAFRAVGSGRGAAWAVAGALLGAAVLARAPLAVAGLALTPWVCVRARWAGSSGFVGAAAAVLAVGLVSFGARTWPEGGWFNARLGNTGLRSGTSDVRPGPDYAQLRIEAAFAAAPGDDDGYHRDRLVAELGDDPWGAITTVARKAHLAVQPVAIVSAADFRHGLERFWPFAILQWSWAWGVPLAAVGWWAARRRSGVSLPALGLPVVGVFAANVVVLTSDRYRFAALPLLAILAGCGACTLAGRWQGDRRALWPLLAAGAVCWVPWSGTGWIVPGDGLIQEAYVRMSRPDERRAAPIGTLIAAARAAGNRDPRGSYLLGLWHEDHGRFDRAVEAYDRALALAPGYAEAAENRLRAMVRGRGFDDAARRFARDAMARIPHAGLLRLNLARLDGTLSVEERAAIEAEGARIEALRARGPGRSSLRIEAVSRGRARRSGRRAFS